MSPDDIGDLSALDRAWGAGDLLPPYRTGGDWWTPPVKAGKLTEALAKGLFGPLGLCLTTDLQGRLTVLDWLDVLGGEVAITTTQTVTGLGAVSDTQPVRVVKWTPAGAGEAPVEWRSELVSQVSGGGKVVETSPGWVQDAGAFLTDRAAAMLQIYQFAVPTVAVEIPVSYALSEGIAAGVKVTLTNPTIWNREGLRGVTDMYGVVLGTSRPLHERGGGVVATVALTGYSIDVDACRWCPSAVVTGIGSAPTYAVTMDSGDAVNLWFGPGKVTQVIILSDTGSVIDPAATVTAATATTMTLSGATGVTVGRRIVPRGASVQVDGLAYLSAGCDYV